MVPPPAARAPRRLVAALLFAVAVLGIVPISASAETAPSAATISSSELAMVNLLNKDRTDAGLVPVRADSRLMAIARARSADMVAKNYFSHTQPDGRNVFDILSAKGITWYNAGEIIAWNTYGMDLTTATANSQWMDSPGHHAIIVSTDFNYVGVGLAVDASGKKLWTAVFIKGPDRTGARAALGSTRVDSGPTSTTRYARIHWSGADVRLQVLTAGLRSFTIQRRMDAGSWATIVSSTTLTGMAMKVSTGHRWEFRIAAVDNRSNRGAWVYKVVDLR